ncbi:MAG TPA: cytochrome c [Bryobacteraceae bacterium]
MKSSNIQGMWRCIQLSLPVAGLLALAGVSMAAEPGGKVTAASAPPVTFAKDVARIFQAKCEECHHKGTAAPMSLVTYNEVRPWARSIKERVVRRNMPPWHIDKNVGIQSFENDRSLTDAQIETIARWVDAGAPLGNPKDMPAAKQWPEGNDWQLAKQFGQPEIVIKSVPYTMPAHGQDVWWKPLNTVPVDGERWVRAVEIRPGTLSGRKITHHAVASLRTEEDANTTGDDGMPNPGGILMEWAIGKNYDTYRENSGKQLKPGDQIVWDIHLHAVGEEIRDNVELALYLYPKGQTPKYKTVLTNFGSTPRGSRGLDIRPNSIAVNQAYHVLKQAARLENFQPHMHLRGKAMSMEAIYPDGHTELLSYADKFNFNWMINYIYTDDAAPVLPKGTIIHITSWHDNTSNNPNNPDPNQWVGQGDRTVDEMAHAWVNVTYISDEDYQAWAAQHRPKKPAASPSAALISAPGVTQ